MKLHYGWVVVAVGALATCVGMGAMFSLPVFLAPIAADTGWPRVGIASAMTLNFLTMGISAFGWGALSDRFGPRRVVLVGVVLLGIGLTWASRSTSLIEFQLVYGVIVGLAGGSFIAPMMGAMTMASSLGMALGPAVGGWIFDTFQSYAWLYIGSFGVGLGAAAIALAFPPVRAGGARPLAQAA